MKNRNFSFDLRADWVKNLVIGLVVGVACVTPGLSGGVIAAAAGIYEPALTAIVSAPRQFKKSVQFLFPLGVGAVVGVLLFSKAMQQLIAYAPYATLYAFIGLVLGSLPALLGDAKKDGQFTIGALVVAALAFASVIVCGPLLAGIAGSSAATGELSRTDALIGGSVLAFGTIVPGISSSFLLMAMGTYEKILGAIADIRITDLFFIGIGAGVTALVIIKLVEVMFRKFRAMSYAAVIGFLIGSIFITFPGFQIGWRWIPDVLLMFACAIASGAVMKLQTTHRT